MTVSSDAPAITGKAVFHLHSCPTRAWLFMRGILVVPRSDDFIRSGERLDAERWEERRRIDLGPFGKADWVTGTQTHPVIHEGSRSARHEEPKRAQLRHYLWAADRLYGLPAEGTLHLAKGSVERVLPDHARVEEDHARLRALAAGPMPPPRRIAICKGCTNKEWCWG